MNTKTNEGYEITGNGKRFRQMYRLAWTGVIFGVLVILCIVAIYVYPYNPIDIRTLKVDKKVVEQGDLVTFQLDAHKYYDVFPECTIELISDCFTSYHIMTYVAWDPPGSSFRARPFVIPHSIPSGRYRIHLTAVYPVAFFRSVTKSVLSDWMVVDNSSFKYTKEVVKTTKTINSKLDAIRNDQIRRQKLEKKK